MVWSPQSYVDSTFSFLTDGLKDILLFWRNILFHPSVWIPQNIRLSQVLHLLGWSMVTLIPKSGHVTVIGPLMSCFPRPGQVQFSFHLLYPWRYSRTELSRIFISHNFLRGGTPCVPMHAVLISMPFWKCLHIRN